MEASKYTPRLSKKGITPDILSTMKKFEENVIKATWWRCGEGAVRHVFFLRGPDIESSLIKNWAPLSKKRDRHVRMVYHQQIGLRYTSTEIGCVEEI